MTRIVSSAPTRYKRFSIPKRSGAGLRTIAQPSRELKAVQRWIVEHVLADLPVHSAATAYEAGASIRDNATRHLGSRFLLKADIREFFPSIRQRDVFAHFTRHLSDQYSRDDLELICRAVLWYPSPRERELELCIGAPSSPRISNSVMFDFDVAVTRWCARREVTYTRYADDLTFSTIEENVLGEAVGMMRELLVRLEYPRLFLNDRKLVSVSTKTRRTVTGLVLANQGYVSLGRERKRKIRAMIHRFSQGLLDDEASMRLQGLLSFAADVEHDFVRRMEVAYSPELLARIRAFGSNQRDR